MIFYRQTDINKSLNGNQNDFNIYFLFKVQNKKNTALIVLILFTNIVKHTYKGKKLLLLKTFTVIEYFE